MLENNRLSQLQGGTNTGLRLAHHQLGP